MKSLKANEHSGDGKQREGNKGDGSECVRHRPGKELFACALGNGRKRKRSKGGVGARDMNN
jgi:hypothetical protein